MSVKHSWSPWLLAANVPAGVVLVLLILDPTRDLWPVVCPLAVGAWRRTHGTRGHSHRHPPDWED
jgi:hypothetical protein